MILIENRLKYIEIPSLLSPLAGLLLHLSFQIHTNCNYVMPPTSSTPFHIQCVHVCILPQLFTHVHGGEIFAGVVPITPPEGIEVRDFI